MKLKTKILFVLSLGYLLLLLLGTGYYKTSCICSYKFYLFKPSLDCARFCDKYKEISNFQKIINILLLKK